MSAVVERETIAAIRTALLIGLASFGEIERLENEVKMRTINNEEMPDDLRPIHPTGTADVVSQFATALRLIDDLETYGN